MVAALCFAHFPTAAHGALATVPYAGLEPGRRAQLRQINYKLMAEISLTPPLINPHA